MYVIMDALTKQRGNETRRKLVEMVSFKALLAAPTCVFCVTKTTLAPSGAWRFVAAAAMNPHIPHIRGR